MDRQNGTRIYLLGADIQDRRAATAPAAEGEASQVELQKLNATARIGTIAAQD